MIIHIITKKNLPLYFPRVSMKNFWPWHFRRSDRKSKNNLTTNKVLIKTFSNNVPHAICMINVRNHIIINYYHIVIFPGHL